MAHLGPFWLQIFGKWPIFGFGGPKMGVPGVKIVENRKNRHKSVILGVSGPKNGQDCPFWGPKMQKIAKIGKKTQNSDFQQKFD